MKKILQKAYDGREPVIHVVAKGQTLSNIGQIYFRSADWRPVYIYNTQIHKSLASASPDRIREGQQLIVPRSPEGYDLLIDIWIGQLRKSIAREFEAKQMYDSAIIDVGLMKGYADFAAEILTTTATLFLKAAEGAKAATALARAKDDVYAWTYRFVSEFDDDMYDMDIGKSILQGFKATIQKMTPGAEKLATKIVKGFAPSGNTAVLFYKFLKEMRKGNSAGWSALAKVQAGFGAAWALLEYVEYTKPSRLMDCYWWHAVGEASAEDTFAKAKIRMEGFLSEGTTRIEKHIAKLKKEKLLVWGAPYKPTGNARN